MKNTSSTWLQWCQEYKKAPYTPKVALTHKLFIIHKSISKVAKEREVNEETIERQIIQLIVKGIISIDEVVEEKVKKEVLDVLENKKITKLSEIKGNIDRSISWFEIKAVISSTGIEA